MAIEGGRTSKKDKDLIAESRAYKAAAQRKAQRSAHAQWRGDALQAVGLKEDGKMRRQVERRAAAQAKNRKARIKNARRRAEDKSRRFVGKLGWAWPLSSPTASASV